jgi:hypothetical protein
LNSNRLCDPESKPGVLRWVQTVTLPGVFAQRAGRTSRWVEEALASLLCPLVDQDMTVVFYDMTTIRAAGLSIDVYIIHDTTPFGLSLSKPFDKLRANGNKLPVMIYKSLNKQCGDVRKFGMSKKKA